MDTNYCLFIDRLTAPTGTTDFTDLPSDSLRDLIDVGQASLRIPYTSGYRIATKLKEIEDLPFWAPAHIEVKRTGFDPRIFYQDEEAFKRDLKAALNNDSLFQRVYINKEKWKSFLDSRGTK